MCVECLECLAAQDAENRTENEKENEELSPVVALPYQTKEPRMCVAPHRTQKEELRTENTEQGTENPPTCRKTPLVGLLRAVNAFIESDLVDIL